MKFAALLIAFSTCASAALAADLPPPPAPMPRAPATYVPMVTVYNWTGFYLGGNLGGGASQGGLSDPFGNTVNSNNNFRFLGGGQVGFNYEFGNGVLIGAEAMFDWLPNNGNTTAVALGPPFIGGPAASVTLNNSWLTTFTGRLGYAWDRLLIYGKGGGAWVGVSNSNVTIAGVGVQTAGNNFGWTVGAGLEYAVWGNLSARVEYDFIGLTSQSFTVPPIAGVLLAADTFTGNNRNIQMVTVGLNYRFGGW